MSNRQSGKAALERGFAPLLFTPSLGGGGGAGGRGGFVG